MLFLFCIGKQVKTEDCRTSGCGKGAECVRDQLGFHCQCPPGAGEDCFRGIYKPVVNILTSLITNNNFNHVCL